MTFHGRGETQGVETPQQTYFVSASTSSSPPSSSRVRSFYSSCSSNNPVVLGGEGWKGESAGMGVLKTVDVEVTVEKDEEAVVGLGRWCESEKERAEVGIRPSLAMERSELGFVTGSGFLEDIIEVSGIIVV